MSNVYAFFKGTPLILSPGGSAAAAGELVAKQGGKTIEYLFIIEATFLNPHSKLDASVYSIIQVGDDATVDSGRDADVCGPRYLTSVDDITHAGGPASDDPKNTQKFGSKKPIGLSNGERKGSEQL